MSSMEARLRPQDQNLWKVPTSTWRRWSCSSGRWSTWSCSSSTGSSWLSEATPVSLRMRHITRAARLDTHAGDRTRDRLPTVTADRSGSLPDPVSRRLPQLPDGVALLPVLLPACRLAGAVAVVGKPALGAAVQRGLLTEAAVAHL